VIDDKEFALEVALLAVELVILRYRDSTKSKAKKEAADDIAKLISDLAKAWSK
jgi:hypothetical protein